MKKFDKFYFKSFSFDKKKLQAKFYYSFDNIENFEEIIKFKNNNIILNKNLDNKVIQNYLFNLHLALGISYYKLFSTKELIIESWKLWKNKIVFWKKFYLNWLGEFFIKNNIDPNNLLNFINKNKKTVNQNIKNKDFLKNHIKWEKKLLLIWWWKDSIVSFNFIKNIDFDVFVFGKLDKIKKNTSDLMWKKPLIIKRKLSKNLIKLNKEWYYNWHVPITWIISFVTLFFCYLYNYKYIILSNEKSSSEENIIWKGIKINHQYSKSFKFEKDFSIYLKNYINNDIKYFSLLRWMYEYKIAEIFSKQKKFLKIFQVVIIILKLFQKTKILIIKKIGVLNVKNAHLFF